MVLQEQAVAKDSVSDVDEKLRDLEVYAAEQLKEKSVREKLDQIRASISNATTATETAEKSLRRFEIQEWMDEHRPWEKERKST